jgi:hypothetical protein
MTVEKVTNNASKWIEDFAWHKPQKQIHMTESELSKVELLISDSLNIKYEMWRSKKVSDKIKDYAGEKIILDLKIQGPIWQLSKSEPVILTFVGNMLELSSPYVHILLFQNCFYYVKKDHTPEELKLLVFEAADKDRIKFERLKSKYYSESSQEIKFNRPRISEEVRIAVWRRDEGKCVRCGSRENLEYDHIIPISQGGSNTVRNIELLCEKCNRAKSNNIQ